ncbi:hypothetical protein CRUP_037378, partial [Coryphaenoides rupestris]
EGVLLTHRESLCTVVFSALSENSSDLQGDVERAVDHLTRLILEEDDHGVNVAVVGIAAQALDTDEETGRFLHDVIIPRLLSLALQAALQGEGSSGQRSPLVEEAVLSAMAGDGRWRPGGVPLLEGDVSFPGGDSLPPRVQLAQAGGGQINRVAALSYTSAAKCYAGLVNKSPPRSTNRVCSELDSPASPWHTQAFTFLLWLAKGLLLRYHPLSTTLTDKLFSLLSDPALGSLAAEGFSLLMSDSSDVLNRECHADVRLMYRQRFFTENSAKLLQGFSSATPGTGLQQ